VCFQRVVGIAGGRNFGRKKAEEGGVVGAGRGIGGSGIRLAGGFGHGGRKSGAGRDGTPGIGPEATAVLYVEEGVDCVLDLALEAGVLTIERIEGARRGEKTVHAVGGNGGAGVGVGEVAGRLVLDLEIDGNFSGGAKALLFPASGGDRLDDRVFEGSAGLKFRREIRKEIA